MESRFLQSYQNEMKQYYQNDSFQNKYEFENISLGLIAGTFRPPIKEDLDRIIELANQVDKVVVFISNNNPSNKLLSVAQSKELGSIVQGLNKISNKPCFSKIKKEIDELIENENNLTYFNLNYILSDVLIINSTENSVIRIQEKIRNFLKKLKKSAPALNLPEVSASKCKEIFKIYLETYNLTNKVEIRISQYTSPFIDQLNLIKHCKNCSIIINTTNKNITELKNNYDNNIYFSYYRYIGVHHSTVLMNLNDLKREWFPKKLLFNDFQKIQNILRNLQNE
jgi:hypothetical protein